MSQTLAPFSCTYSPNLSELLWELNCTIAISTYQAGKVIFISATDPNSLIQLPRDFEKPMGMAVSGKRMAIATRNEVHVLANSSALAPNFPSAPGRYDGLYIPRAVYYTGEVDMHDMHWGNDGLWGVNTRFSCLCKVDDEYSFNIKWIPPFVTDFTPDDRCHLNGMAMKDGRPKYVTALGKTNAAKAWREYTEKGGLIMDVDTSEILLENLPMPHSPRIYDGKLYFLCSATGELVCADLKTGKYDVITQMKGFVRGMSRIGDHLFIGLSKLRQNASTFRNLPIARESIFCGVMVIHLPSGLPVAHLKYENSVEEIYDVQILPGIRRPGIMNNQTFEHKLALTTNRDCFWSVPENMEAKK